MNDKRLPIEPGHLDRRVVIQQATESTDGAGMSIVTWTNLVTVWMGRQALMGQERWQSGEVQARYDSRWLMQYRADMDPDLVDVPKLRQLVFSGRTHQIVKADHLGRKAGIELTTMTSTRV